MKEQDLKDTRTQIDDLDRRLIRLLKERMDAVQKAGATKSEDPNTPLFDPERESEVFRSWSDEAESQGLSSYFTGRILREVLNYSRRSQEPLVADKEKSRTSCRVGYQGVSSSFSDLAIGKLFAHRGHAVVDRRGYASFADVLDALERDEVDYALLPVENSLTGSISEVNHLLVSRNVSVVDEEVWELEQCLVGLPGVAIAELREVRSHPVALQQCQRFLGSLEHAKPSDYFDTAGAAQSIKDANDPVIGCICSAAAAHLRLT